MSYVASFFRKSIAFATIYTELDAGVVSAAYFSRANATRTPHPRLLPLSSVFQLIELLDTREPICSATSHLEKLAISKSQRHIQRVVTRTVIAVSLFISPTATHTTPSPARSIPPLFLTLSLYTLRHVSLAGCSSSTGAYPLDEPKTRRSFAPGHGAG